jgi:hypothetical protein
LSWALKSSTLFSRKIEIRKILSPFYLEARQVGAKMLLMLVASAWEGVHSHLLACALWIEKFLNKSGMVCSNKYYVGVIIILTRL